MSKEKDNVLNEKDYHEAQLIIENSLDYDETHLELAQKVVDIYEFLNSVSDEEFF